MDRFSNGSGDTKVLVLRRGSDGVTRPYDRSRESMYVKSEKRAEIMRGAANRLGS